ncbi:Protein BZZ1 [Spathaspora sp. JA1]|nr:Protein BZZ1 [Spathaspora sp. JA1]
MSEISIGNELKDSYKPTVKWINNNINFLADIDEFYRERSTIEKEYSSKLKELCKRQFDKKSKLSASLSVGDEPGVTPGSLECASLVLWTELLSQTEAIANERAKLATDFATMIGSNVMSLKAKCERIVRSTDAINDFLTKEKKGVEEEVNKAKKAYDVLCQATESAREKSERNNSEKYTKRLDEKSVDMNNGKNEYLIKINTANRLKDKYYYQDIPELLDYLQELNQDRVSLVNKLLKNASIIERNSNDKVKEKLHSIDQTIDQNKPHLDVAMFIKHNQLDWKEPADFYFIPSSIWHDDESLIIKEPELTVLKKRLNTASGQYSKYEQSCIDIKQKLEEFTSERKKESENLTLKFDSSLLGSLSVLEKFIKEDTQRVRAEVEIEIIQNFAGDQDLSYIAPITQKKSTFGSLFKKKEKDSGVASDDSSTHSLSTTKTNTTLSHVSTGIFNLRRNRTVTSTAGGDSGNAKALYEYQATGSDETSITAGESVTVLEPDDGGWTLIEASAGKGLVPTSYLEIIQSDNTSLSSLQKTKKQGPAVAPRRGGKKVSYVQALYDYTADGDDEISIRAGDKIVLVQEDTDGSGWTEGELNGARGVFPTSYVKKV